MGLRFTILIGQLKEDVMGGLFHETVEDTMSEIPAIICYFK